MTWHPEDLKHVVHHDLAIFFVLQEPLTNQRFQAVVRTLEAGAAGCDTATTPDAHWLALTQRMKGESRWDKVVARYQGPQKTKEDGIRQRATFHNVVNIVQRREYTAYTIQGIQYVVDLFNPANVLEMPYADAGEPVLALLLRELGFGTVQSRLVENNAFYRIIREIDGVLEPECVRGTYSMFPILLAYQEGRLDPQRRPWDLLFPLSVLNRPSELRPPADLTRARTTNDSLALLWPILTSPGFREVPLARLFKRVEVWDADRVLVQVWNGIDSVLRDEYAQAARALGMMAVQELLPS